MKIKHKINVLELFIISIAVAGILLAIDAFITNRLSTNIGRIVTTIILGIMALPLFIVGAKKSIKMKYSAWAALNIIAIIVIVFCTVWFCLLIYALKDIQIIIPG